MCFHPASTQTRPQSPALTRTFASHSPQVVRQGLGKNFKKIYVPAIRASIKAANEIDNKEAELVAHEKFDDTPVGKRGRPLRNPP